MWRLHDIPALQRMIHSAFKTLQFYNHLLIRLLFGHFVAVMNIAVFGGQQQKL